MKNHIFFLLLIIPSLSTIHLFAQQTVGVLDITPMQGVSEMETNIVTEFVYDSLYRFGSGRYRIISRQNRESILAEHEFALSGFCDDASCALEVGKYLSADYVIIGSFTRFGTKYYLSLQLVNVNTTEVSGSYREGADDLDGIAAKAVDACVAGVFGGTQAAAQAGPAPVVSSRRSATTATLSASGNDMIFVEGGTFRMGSMDGHSHQRPVHSVMLSSFTISKYEVTQGLWQEVMGSNPSDSTCGIGNDYPVNKVSWYDAVAFCNALSERDGLEPAYRISGTDVSCDFGRNGYRLPTEAEWEYAARGGNESRGYTYAGSNSIGDVAWYIENGGGKAHPVGGKRANELGIYDMTGNLYEWCWDRYSADYYSNSPSSDPTGPSSGSDRVFRGGCWNGFALISQVFNRVYDIPGDGYCAVGFRVARSR